MKRIVKRVPSRINESKRSSSRMLHKRSIKEGRAPVTFIEYTAKVELDGYVDCEIYEDYTEEETELNLYYALNDYRTYILDRLERYFKNTLYDSTYKRDDIYAGLGKSNDESFVVTINAGSMNMSEDEIVNMLNELIDEVDRNIFGEVVDFQNYGMSFEYKLTSSNVDLSNVSIKEA